MIFINNTNFILAIIMSFVLAPAKASDNTASVEQVSKEWAQANFQMADQAQESMFEKLLQDVEQLKQANRNDATALIWSGIVKSSYAGIKGGIGALSLVKEAKKDLERALEIDADALNGSAQMSLGTLYHKVPGWPIGFGDDKKAEQYLKKALEINPNNKGANYFYGEYLYDEGHYRQAKSVLTHALEIAPRQNARIVDEHRHNEIKMLLAKVTKRLDKKSRKKNN
jgi:tetratricopeptide (TPR) repeat protein